MPVKLKRFLWTLVAAFGLPVLVFVGVFVATMGQYSVPATLGPGSEQPTLQLNQATFHVQTFGEPSQPPLLVVHDGPGGDHRSLLPLKALADSHYVIFYDQRGTGLSPRVPNAQLSIELALQDLEAFVLHYGKGRPVALLGHGWGGMLAASYAVREPARVSRLMLAEPGFLNEELAAQIIFAGGRDSTGLLLKTAASWVRALHIPKLDPDMRRDFVFGQIRVQKDYYCERQLPADLPERSWRSGFGAWKMITQATLNEEGKIQLDFLKGIDKYADPVLFLASSCNTLTGREFQARQAKLFAQAAMVSIPQSSHDLFWDNPQASLAAVRQFLDSGKLPGT